MINQLETVIMSNSQPLDAKTLQDATQSVKQSNTVVSTLTNINQSKGIFVKRGIDIAKALGISVQTWQKWKRSEDFNLVPKDDGYEIEGLLAYQKVKQSKDNRQKSIVINTGKAKKLEIEIELLKVKHKKIIGELISYQDHLDEMVELMSIVKSSLDIWIGEISLLKDDKILKLAEIARDKALMQLREQLQMAYASDKSKPIIIKEKETVVTSSNSSSSSSSSSSSID